MEHGDIEKELQKYSSLTEKSNLESINFSSVWSGSASESATASLNKVISDLKEVESQIKTFETILAGVEELKTKKLKIDALESEIASINIYRYNSETGQQEVDPDKELLKKTLESERDRIIQEYNELKEQLISSVNSITGAQAVQGSSGVQTRSGEISYEDAKKVADKLQVPVEYILSLHLHEGYQLGDKIVQDGITPDMIHYAGEHGYPIVIDGINNSGTEYYAEGRGCKLYKSDATFTIPKGGQEYNITGQPITYSEMEGRNVYWTWYGPICQGFGGPPAPVQCTQSLLYPCDDGLYRDKDGYIVIAGSPYKNQFYDGVHVNYDAHGGLPEEDLYILTPFGIGKLYDNGGILVQNGIECDFYRNDGYESNNIAQTEYGRRLRSSAVEGYESLNLYWNQMIH